ncbi:MAG: glycosyltransferase [Pseudoalteromonas nigrifaciens]|uniref:glycosyltransferase n=1 Tax=Pseudoalteromonas nigrifaciens TaxID=28109 RepID=UPI003F954CA0
MKLLINTSNLHVGGGVQVASSFISELAEMLKGSSKAYDISLICSTSVKSNISITCDLSLFTNVKVLDIYGIKSQCKKNKKLFDGFDVCFTVFGPFYFTPKVKKHICGFAQPWIAYPNNDAYSKLTIINRFKTKLKFVIQCYYFKKYDQLIVEQQHVKNALINVGFLQDKISVVSNCVSTIYDAPKEWKTLNFDSTLLKCDLTLGFIGRSYPHKNIAILKEVNQILCEDYNFECNFIFTFTDDEMRTCGFSELDNFFSVGSIKVEQCPSFYQLLDGLVFPSLLECFSASPIEAMKMNTTVLSSNYPFVTEVCQDAAFYFDALDANSIADSIISAFSNKELLEKKRALGLELVRNLPSAKDRALAYLKIIN